jgi:hypothetical protein
MLHTVSIMSVFKRFLSFSCRRSLDRFHQLCRLWFASGIIRERATHVRIEIQIIPTIAHPTKRCFGFSSHKNLDPAGYLQMYRYSSFMVSSTRIAIYLRRSVHGWKLRRGILFPHMSGHIIYGLDLHLLLRRSTLTHFDMYFVYFYLVGFF